MGEVMEAVDYSDGLRLSPGDVPARGGMPKLLGVQTVSRILGCSAAHVYGLVYDNRLPRPMKVGHMVRWKATGPGSIAEWIALGFPPNIPL